VTATTRLAINVLQSARARIETCVGPQSSEPIDTGHNPGTVAELGEALNRALLHLLQTLSPLERAVYVLREAFNYPYREIAAILGVEEANARQLFTRAREHMSGQRRTFVNPAEHRRLLNAFVAAARKGDLDGLESLLASDVARALTVTSRSAARS
jgi:RNA polymerase sigma-70 factor (ECF subfamily)